MVSKFRPKMHEYEAIQFMEKDTALISEWMGDSFQGTERGPLGHLYLKIKTKSGDKFATEYAHFIVKDKYGEFYPMEMDRFLTIFYCSSEAPKELQNAANL